MSITLYLVDGWKHHPHESWQQRQRAGLDGSVSTAGTAASSIEREAGAGQLPYVSLSGTAGVVSRTFDIGGGGANLTIAPIIQNGAATTASIIKSGTGTLTFSGAEANTYSGETTINAGTLRLNKTDGVTSVAGNIIINTGGTLQLSTNNQIADTAGITFNGGTMTGWTTDETIAFLTQNSGGLATSGNTGHVIVNGALTLAGGSTLTINSNPGSANPASWNVGSAVLTGADILIGGSNGAANPRTSLGIGRPVSVRGRLWLAGGVSKSLDGATLALAGEIGGPGEGCVSLGLAAHPWSPRPDLWKCRGPAGPDACCDAEPDRPPFGTEIIVSGVVESQIQPNAGQAWSVGRLLADSFCVVESTP